MSNCVMITIIICVALVIMNFTDDVCRTIREVACAKYNNVTTESDETANEKQSEKTERGNAICQGLK